MKGSNLKIRLENVNLSSNSGPNSFAQKLVRQFKKQGHSLVHQGYNTALCFIEDHSNLQGHNLVQRLDGIYFNTEFNYNLQNQNILKTYKKSSGVIFQSEFSKKLVEAFFGEHDNSTVIHNGADIDLISLAKPTDNKILNSYNRVWSCAASWRPHKRLKENISYFLEHKGDKDCLVVAGKPDYYFKDPNIYYVGELNYEKLLSLYKKSFYFLHLGWLDNCPNVVVDARAAGCHVVCTDAGGTVEVAGINSTVIEDWWDFKPTELYKPPRLDFSKKIKNTYDTCYDMEETAKKYINFMSVNFK